MKKLMPLLAFVCLALSASWSQAADGPANAQQNRMVTCNANAGSLKGDERKAFMKTCLSNKKISQQEKMKVCNKDAAGRKGDDRKKFMSDCLSAH